MNETQFDDIDKIIEIKKKKNIIIMFQLKWLRTFERIIQLENPYGLILSNFGNSIKIFKNNLIMFREKRKY